MVTLFMRNLALKDFIVSFLRQDQKVVVCAHLDFYVLQELPLRYQHRKVFLPTRKGQFKLQPAYLAIMLLQFKRPSVIRVLLVLRVKWTAFSKLKFVRLVLTDLLYLKMGFRAQLVLKVLGQKTGNCERKENVLGALLELSAQLKE
jgi:hypothetical protein